MFWERGFTHWVVVAHSHYFSPFPRFTGMWQLRGAPRVELHGLCCHIYDFDVYCRLWLERLQSYVNSLFLVSLWMIANFVYSGRVARRGGTPACSRWAVVGCWLVLQGYYVRLKAWKTVSFQGKLCPFCPRKLRKILAFVTRGSNLRPNYVIVA